MLKLKNIKSKISEGLSYQSTGSILVRLKKWRLGSHIGFNSPNLLLQRKSSGYFSNHYTINKYFLRKSRINAGLSIISPFRNNRYSTTATADSSFNQLYSSNTVVRRLSLSISYQFSRIATGN